MSAEPLCTRSSAERAARVTFSEMGWSGIVLVLWEWSELHCSVLAATFWWCSLEHRGEQHCSSRSWTGSDYCNAMITHAGQSTGSLGRALRLSFVSVVYKNVYIIIWLCITNATENAKQLRLPATCTSYCTSWPEILPSGARNFSMCFWALPSLLNHILNLHQRCHGGGRTKSSSFSWIVPTFDSLHTSELPLHTTTCTVSCKQYGLCF